MATRTHGERLDRLEQVVQILAEDQVSLQKIVADFATETRRGFDRVAAQFEEVGEQFRQTAQRMRETDEHMRETDEHMRETDERMRKNDERARERSRQLDDRIDKLVIAIGEFIRKQ